MRRIISKKNWLRLAKNKRSTGANEARTNRLLEVIETLCISMHLLKQAELEKKISSSMTKGAILSSRKLTNERFQLSISIISLNLLIQTPLKTFLLGLDLVFPSP